VFFRCDILQEKGFRMVILLVIFLTIALVYGIVSLFMFQVHDKLK
jgi:uncharacterized protein involved in cysteine biosynthesis